MGNTPSEINIVLDLNQCVGCDVLIEETRPVLVAHGIKPDVSLELQDGVFVDVAKSELNHIIPLQRNNYVDVIQTPNANINLELQESSGVSVELFGATVGLVDAPVNGDMYGRRAGRWEVITPVTVVQQQTVIPVPGNSSIYMQAAYNIGGNRIISTANGLARYADHTDQSLPAIGLSVGAVSINEIVSIQTSGTMVITGMLFAPGGDLFVGTNGLITQVPPTSGYIQRIGTAQTNEIIIIEISQPIYL